MMNSDIRLDAEKIVEKVFNLIDEQYLNHLIDAPIGNAADGFVFKQTDPVTYKDFIHAASTFVRHLYKHGLGVRQTLSDSQSRTEALTILEKGYQGPYGRGWYAAFLDASRSKLHGLEFVLSKMAEVIKTSAREKHLAWVYSSQISFAGWPTRCMIVKILLERWEPFLSPHILGCPSPQLADHLPELINILRSSDALVDNMLGTDTILNGF
jgi:hypothetical protein